MSKMSNLTKSAVILTLLYFLLGAPFAMAAKTGSQEPFTIDDYFKLKWVGELSLSSDGAMVAYVTKQQSLEANKSVRTVYVSATMKGAEPIIIDDIQGARQLQWIPGTHELGYISSDGGLPQVYSVDIKDQKKRQHTDGGEPVLNFRFSPDGRSLAWTTRSTDVTSSEFKEYQRSTLYDRLFNGEEGVIIDTETTSSAYFTNPNWPDITARSYRRFFVKHLEESAAPIAVPGQIKDFNWSPDSSKISVVYTDGKLPEGAYHDRYTSVGILNVPASTFRPIANASVPPNTSGAVYYDGGEWAPGKDQLFLYRIEKGQRLSFQRTAWTSIDLSDKIDPDAVSNSWHEFEIYRNDRKPHFLPTSDGEIYSNKTIAAKRFLYRITPNGERRADILGDIDGDISHFQFSADFESAVFVNESMTRPPELYVWSEQHGTMQLTDINSSISQKQLPTAREVTWRSTDNTEVQGWLIEPPRTNDDPVPMVTFVPGGPGLAFTNEFAFYFKSYFGGVWPYPFEVYALNGMAVFIPNYRGKKTFGIEFANETAYDDEPVDDISTGVTYLIDQGIADPNHLAISGQSHGAWLAPMVMVRDRRYVAGSFAEGAMNHFVIYATNPGFINRNSDLGHNANPYDNPERYVEVSPDFHYQGLKTAILFEAGVKANALRMMGSPKAARHAGLPAEFIVYPQTSHNIHIPSLQRESAERNLDWFRFWLLGQEDRSLDKVEQYERWRTMRPEYQPQH